jgi:hypothetical protein
VVAVGWFALRGDSTPEAAELTLNRAQNEGWYDAMGDFDRGLPYGWSAAQLARTQVDSTYKADYFEYYVDAWSYGVGVGLCSAIEDAGMASGAQFLPTP